MQRVDIEPLRMTPVPATAELPSVSRPRTILGQLALASVVLAYLGVILLAPIVALVVETAKVGFGPALEAVSTPDALERSFWLVIIALAVNTVAGVLGAIAIVRHRFPGRRLLSALFDLPLAVSPVMIGLGFLLLVGRDGLFASALTALSLNVVFSFPGLVMGTLFVTLPYTVREIAYVLEEIGTSEEEAATTLGASPWQTFFHVTLPNIRLALGYGLLMTAARTLGEFGAVLVLGGSISGQTQTATTFIHDAIEERQLAGAYGMAMVLAVVSVALLLVLEFAKSRRQPATAGKAGT